MIKAGGKLREICIKCVVRGSVSCFFIYSQSWLYTTPNCLRISSSSSASSRESSWDMVVLSFSPKGKGNTRRDGSNHNVSSFPNDIYNYHHPCFWRHLVEGLCTTTPYFGGDKYLWADTVGPPPLHNASLCCSGSYEVNKVLAEGIWSPCHSPLKMLGTTCVLESVKKIYITIFTMIHKVELRVVKHTAQSIPPSILALQLQLIWL